MGWQKNVPTTYTKPHLAVMGLLNELQKEGMDFTYISEQKVKTRFREWPFQVDILIIQPFNGVIEILGRRFHDHSKRQRQKVEVKRECLEGEGYRYLQIWDIDSYDGCSLYKKGDLPKVKEKIREWLGE